jgi:hypothetical protein
MGFGFFLIFGGIMFAIAAAHKRHVEAAWGTVARDLGLQLQTGGIFTRPSLSGTMGNIGVRVHTVNKGKNNVYTVYAVRYAARTRPFRLSREHMLSGLARMFGAEDVEIGDHRFDTSFMVNAQDPDALAAYLTPSRRIELVAFAATNRSMVATEASVEATYRGADSRADRIITRIRRIVSVAEHLSHDDVFHHDQDAALVRREAGELAESARDLKMVGRAHPTDYGVRLAEIEAMVAAEQLDEAAAGAEKLAVELPADEALDGWIREIGEQKKEHAAAAARPDAKPEPAAPLDLPADGIVQDLFGSTKLSFETAERFRLEYKNRQVDWQGTVRSSREFSSDYDFGPDPGVKAVVTVAEVTHDLYGNSRIDAVVHFPANTALARDDVITFTGRLIKIDPLMRNIYVADGAIIED